jgi:hypothetical protein
VRPSTAERAGTAEVVALGEGAAELAQRVELVFGLDALGHAELNG